MTSNNIMQSDNNYGERTAALAFCRDTITRIADKGQLQRAHIETLLSERDFCQQFFKLFDHKGTGALVQEEWITLLKENTR